MEALNPFDPFAGYQACDGGLLEEVKRKHCNNPAAVSKQVIVFTSVVLEALQSQGLQPTPTALFAELLATLEREEVFKNPEVVAAVCNVISMCVMRIPTAVLKEMSSRALKILQHVVLLHKGKAGPVKASLKCLGQFLAIVPDIEPFKIMLDALCNPSAQVRKIAVSGLQEILVGHRESAAAEQLYPFVCQGALAVLCAPERAAKIAASVPKKQRREKENDIKDAVLHALHLLSGLKELLPLIEGAAAMEICGALFKLFSLHQHLLSVSACDVLKAFFSSPQEQIAASVLVKLLKVLLEEVAVINTSEREISGAMCGVLERGYCKLYKMSNSLCLAELPGAVHYLTNLLAAEHDGVRYAAMQSLTSLLSTCLDKPMVSLEVASGMQDTERPSPLVSIVAAVSSTLGPRYQDAQAMALPVVKSLIEKLGREGSSLATGLIEQIGIVYGALVEAEEEEDPTDELRHYLGVGEAALGAAIRHLGPEHVLEVLPLNIIEGLDGESDEHRTWLLPLLKKYVECGSLKFWASELLPYARELGNRAAAAKAAHQTQLASKCNALELQLWKSLPSFSNWCRDADTAFGECVQFVGMAFDRRKDLQHPICQALVHLASQSRAVLLKEGMNELCGFGSPPGFDEDEAWNQLEEGLTSVPQHYTPQLAAGTLTALRSHSSEWLQALYTAYINTDASERRPFFKALAAYATITEPNVLAKFFEMILANLIKCIQGGDAAASVQIPGSSDDFATQCTFMELILSIAGGLDDVGIGHLYKVAMHTIEVKQPTIQKKAYKILQYIVNTRDSFMLPHLEEVVNKLKSGVVLCLPPAKRFRMHCLVPIIKHLGAAGNASAENQEAIVVFVGEILLCTKEQNRKAVDEAYKALVGLAEHAIEGSQGFLRFLNVVMSGLMSQMPRAISATVQGLTRLVHKYYALMEPVADKLLMTVLTLIRAKCSEVDASVLGFVNVCAMKYSIALLMHHLRDIVDAVLIWRDDPKCKLRVKVRAVMMRLATRCGFENVQKLIPENYAKAFSHIQRTVSKRERKRREGASQLDGDAEGDDMILGDEIAESEWAHSKFFSHAPGMQQSVKNSQSHVRRSTVKSGASASNPFRFGRLSEGKDPLDMLDTSTSRTLAKAAAGMGGGAKTMKNEGDEDGPMNLPVNEDGKLVIDTKILEKEQKKENKRKRDLAHDSDQDDDVRTHRSGVTTRSGASRKSRNTARTHKTARSKVSSHHSGQRFKANRGAGGDMQGQSKLEPFAYWKMDRNLLSRRRGKKAAGMRDLSKLVAKGARKAKRFKKN